MMRTLSRLAVAAPLLALAGCYGAPTVDQPVVSGAPAQPANATVAGTPMVAVGYRCYAGAYICPLPAPGPVGTGCSCPGLGAPSYGVVR